MIASTITDQLIGIDKFEKKKVREHAVCGETIQSKLSLSYHSNEIHLTEEFAVIIKKDPPGAKIGAQPVPNTCAPEIYEIIFLENSKWLQRQKMN